MRHMALKLNYFRISPKLLVYVLRPLLEVLRSRNIQYRWKFPFCLSHCLTANTGISPCFLRATRSTSDWTSRIVHFLLFIWAPAPSVTQSISKSLKTVLQMMEVRSYLTQIPCISLRPESMHPWTLFNPAQGLSRGLGPSLADCKSLWTQFLIALFLFISLFYDHSLGRAPNPGCRSVLRLARYSFPSSYKACQLQLTWPLWRLLPVNMLKYVLTLI